MADAWTQCLTHSRCSVGIQSCSAGSARSCKRPEPQVPERRRPSDLQCWLPMLRGQLPRRKHLGRAELNWVHRLIVATRRILTPSKEEPELLDGQAASVGVSALS